MQKPREKISMKRFYFLLTISITLMSCSLTKKEEKFIPQNNVVIETSHEYFEVENFYI